MAYSLPQLGYGFAELEPHLDAKTMEIHHGKHHATYVAKLNAAIEKFPQFGEKPIEDLLREWESLPEEIRVAVRNNGGGHANHSLYWQIMGPNGGGEPTGDLADAIGSSFGTFAAFKESLTNAAINQFGSGWAWLVVEKGKLHVCATANQDSPLLKGNTPILGVDVWEHAYYLKYQNLRADYVQAWWQVVKWEEVARRFGDATKSV